MTRPEIKLPAFRIELSAAGRVLEALDRALSERIRRPLVAISLPADLFGGFTERLKSAGLFQVPAPVFDVTGRLREATEGTLRRSTQLSQEK